MTGTRLQCAERVRVAGLKPVVVEAAEELGYFFLELLFFVLDVGDDVAEDVERSYSGVAGAGDGLHGGDEELVDAKAGFERCEGKH